MWGGHSCPPLLLLFVHTTVKNPHVSNARRGAPGRFLVASLLGMTSSIVRALFGTAEAVPFHGRPFP
jgi:hypothetical protein